jgi:hypothetical protein
MPGVKDSQGTDDLNRKEQGQNNPSIVGSFCSEGIMFVLIKPALFIYFVTIQPNFLNPPVTDLLSIIYFIPLGARTLHSLA